MNKQTKSILAVAGISALTLTGVLAAPHGSGHHGTDILHWFVTKTMTNEGVETNAAGSVTASRNAQGAADNQRLNVTVSGLTPDTTYDLMAVTAGSGFADVTQFTTDDNGAATLQYMAKANGNGNGHGHGHGQTNSLPDVLNPISDISQVDVGTITTLDNILFTTNIVLSADLTSPDSLQYLIKRDLGTNGISAELEIKGTTTKAKFKLTASGLAASTDYWLVFNGSVVQTNTSTAGGKLVISSAPLPANILDLTSVALQDTNGVEQVSTTLP